MAHSYIATTVHKMFHYYLKFLIDTGSSCSVIPVDPNSRDHPQDYLSAVNGSSVPTFGCKNITIDL